MPTGQSRRRCTRRSTTRASRALSEGVGGPMGARAGRHRWWTPVRVVLALTALCFALGMVKDAPCYQPQWSDANVNYTHMCYSDLPYLYTGRGFAELHWPVRRRRRGPGAGTPRWSTPSSSPTGPGGRRRSRTCSAARRTWRRAPGVPADALAGEPEVRKEMLRFVAVNAVGFAALALLAAWLLAGVHRGRPWDAAFFALSPALLLAGLVNWDMLAVTCVAAALWAWSRDRTVADRRDDRPGRGHQALPAVPARRHPRHLPAAAPVPRSRRGLRRGGRDVAAAQRAGVRRRAGGLEDASGGSTPTAPPTWARSGWSSTSGSTGR